jgi:hypothetical protein
VPTLVIRFPEAGHSVAIPVPDKAAMWGPVPNHGRRGNSGGNLDTLTMRLAAGQGLSPAGDRKSGLGVAVDVGQARKAVAFTGCWPTAAASVCSPELAAWGTWSWRPPGPGMRENRRRPEHRPPQPPALDRRAPTAPSRPAAGLGRPGGIPADD